MMPVSLLSSRRFCGTFSVMVWKDGMSETENVAKEMDGMVVEE
jgi:hypothetical protein